jgi:uroporphyrin-III C-methyltransferase/precorrin-2 dehydrogenase/sirohydrochlorin ferrochelatase
VRLKGGDAFVFGRGGEEARALLMAGISFDVVPGVTSAVAAPALAGIPVTHRGVASALVIVSGHDEDACAEAAGRVGENGVTLVVLMGMGRRAALASRLMNRGWRPETPAAVIVDASLPQQRTWRGTLAELASEDCTAAVDSPGTIVIGEVAAFELRERRETPRDAREQAQGAGGRELRRQGAGGQ